MRRPAAGGIVNGRFIVVQDGEVAYSGNNAAAATEAARQISKRGAAALYLYAEAANTSCWRFQGMYLRGYKTRESDWPIAA